VDAFVLIVFASPVPPDRQEDAKDSEAEPAAPAPIADVDAAERGGDDAEK
jgi:hypothetical protein